MLSRSRHSDEKPVDRLLSTGLKAGFHKDLPRQAYIYYNDG